MKPVDPSVYRAALDRIDILKEALKDCADVAGGNRPAVGHLGESRGEYIYRVAKAALATVADAEERDQAGIQNSVVAVTARAEAKPAP